LQRRIKKRWPRANRHHIGTPQKPAKDRPRPALSERF